MSDSLVRSIWADAVVGNGVEENASGESFLTETNERDADPGKSEGKNKAEKTADKPKILLQQANLRDKSIS